MKNRMGWAILASIAVASSAMGCGKREDPAGTAPVTSAATVAPRATAAAKPKYPDTVEGLTALMNELVAVASKDSDKGIQLLAPLLFDEHDTFFAETFGPVLGAAIAAGYDKPAVDELAQMMRDINKNGWKVASVERFTKAGDPAINTYQDKAFERMVKPVALYSVRLRGAAKGTHHFYSFVHRNGEFKYADDMRAVLKTPPEDAKIAAVLELRNRDRETFFNTGKVPEEI